MPRFGTIFEKQFSVLSSQEKAGAGSLGKAFGLGSGAGLSTSLGAGAADSVKVLRTRFWPCAEPKGPQKRSCKSPCLTLIFASNDAALGASRGA